MPFRLLNRCSIAAYYEIGSNYPLPPPTIFVYFTGLQCYWFGYAPSVTEPTLKSFHRYQMGIQIVEYLQLVKRHHEITRMYTVFRKIAIHWISIFVETLVTNQPYSIVAIIFSHTPPTRRLNSTGTSQSNISGGTLVLIRSEWDHWTIT